MITTKIEVNTENEMKGIEWKLRVTGYTKTNDCMWVKIYQKRNMEIVLTREY